MKKSRRDEGGVEKERLGTVELVGKHKARVEVGLRVTVSRSYQSVQVNVGYMQECPIKKVDETFKEAWRVAEDEISSRIEDAKKAVILLEKFHGEG